jgi:ABC-2 type transport system permease protein
MIGTILRHEWRSLAADRTAWIVLLLFAGVIAYAVSNGASRVEELQADIAKAAADETARLAKDRAEARRIEIEGKPEGEVSPFAVGPDHPYYIGTRQGTNAFLPPGHLAALALGQSDLYAYGYKVTTGNRESLVTSEPLENPVKLHTGAFDLAFVLIYLYPLLILALSFNLVSGEKEGGTLGLLLSQPLTLRTLILGKVALRALLVLGSAVVFTLAGVLAADVDLSATGAVGRLALWFLAVLAYGGFWFSLAVFVNSRGRGSAANAMVLASCWLVLVVLVPGLVNLVATALYPVPSRVEFVNAMRTASDSARVQGSQLLGRFFEDHPQLAKGRPANPDEASFMVLRLARDEAIARSLEPVFARYEEGLASQRALVDRFRFASPALLLQDALLDAAGTGAARHRRFVADVDAFRRGWREAFAPRYIEEKPAFTAADYDRLPRYTFDEEPASEAAGRAALPLAVLILLPVGIGGLGLRAYRTYAVAGS